MSLRVSKLVWDHFHEGGNRKLALLCLADYADDAGIAWPAMSKIAEKICCGEKQARRVVHDLLNTGIAKVIGNSFGGDPGASRRYQIQIDRLTPSAGATPPMQGRATPPIEGSATDDRPLPPEGVDPSRQCPLTPPAGGSLTVIELSVNGQARTSAGKSAPKAKRKSNGTSPCPNEFEVTEEKAEWAIAAGVPAERVMLETETFLDHFRGNGVQKKDWQATWRNWMRRSVEFAAARSARP